MSKNIQIVKRSTVEVPNISSYKVVLEAVNAENMPNKIFVNQRIRNFAKGTVDDNFAAVCTPVQLEDFLEDEPEQGSSYYRTNIIELVVRTPEMLKSAVDSIIYEVKKLVLDLEAMDDLSQPLLYNINPLTELTEVVELTTPQIAQITTTGISQLSNYAIAALSSSQVSALNTAQVSALTTTQIEALSGIQVGALITSAVAILTSVQIAALRPTTIAGIPTAQLEAMSVAQIDALTTSQISALTAQQITKVSTAAISTLTAAQIVALASGTVAGMTTTEVNALTTLQLPVMEVEDVAALVPTAIRNLTTTQLNSFTTQQLASFTLAQVSALTQPQRASLTAPKLAALPVVPAPVAPAAPTLWRSPTTAAGNVPEIIDLADFASNFVRANTGNAASWVISPYSHVAQGVTTYEGEGVMFTINKLSSKVSKAILTVVYKNNTVSDQRLYMYVRNLTGTIKGSLKVKWNGVTVLSVETGLMPAGVAVDYYPDDLTNFGAAGKLVPGQSTVLAMELEASGATNEIKGEIFFDYPG